MVLRVLTVAGCMAASCGAADFVYFDMASESRPPRRALAASTSRLERDPPRAPLRARLRNEFIETFEFRMLLTPNG